MTGEDTPSQTSAAPDEERAVRATRFVHGTAQWLTAAGLTLMTASCCLGLLSPYQADTRPDGPPPFSQVFRLDEALKAENLPRTARGVLVGTTIIGSMVMAASGLALSGEIRLGSILAPAACGALAVVWSACGGFLVFQPGHRGWGVLFLSLAPVAAGLFLLSLRTSLIWTDLKPIDRSTATREAIGDYERRRRERISAGKS